MSWPTAVGTPRGWTDGELVLARYLNDALAQMDLLHGSHESQEVVDTGDPDDDEDGPYEGAPQIELDAGLKAPHFGAKASQGSVVVRAEHTTGIASTLQMVGRKASALSNGDSVDLLFAVGSAAGTRENLALIRFIRTGASAGDIEFHLYSAGSLVAVPLLILRSSLRAGVATATPGAYGLDVNGLINANAYEGLELWSEPSAGVQLHPYDAEVSGQWISTVATGTAPLVLPNTDELIENLNVDNLKAITWATAQLANTSSDTIDTPGVDYTVATTTTTRAGLHLVHASGVLTLDTGDTAGRFDLKGTGRSVTSKLNIRTVGQKSPFSASWGIVATLGQAISATVSKTAGSGNSTVNAIITAEPVGT